MQFLRLLGREEAGVEQLVGGGAGELDRLRIEQVAGFGRDAESNAGAAEVAEVAKVFPCDISP